MVPFLLKTGKFVFVDSESLKPLNDISFLSATTFEHGRSIVSIVPNEYKVIDRDFKQLTHTPYNDIYKLDNFPFFIGITNNGEEVLDINCNILHLIDSYSNYILRSSDIGDQIEKNVLGRKLHIEKEIHPFNLFFLGMLRDYVFDPLTSNLEKIDNGVLANTPDLYIKKKNQLFRERNSKDYTVKKREEKYGLLNGSGNWLIEPEYEYLGFLTDDYLIAKKILWKEGQGNKFVGIIDSNGQVHLPFEYSQVVENIENLFVWEKEREPNNWIPTSSKGDYISGFIDMNEGFISSKLWESIKVLSNDRILASQHSKQFLIDNRENEIKEISFENLSIYKKGLSIAENKEFKGVVNKLGQIILEVIYDEIHIVNEIFIAAKNKEKWSVFSKEGLSLANNLDNVFARSFDNYIWVSKDLNWFLMNKYGVFYSEEYINLT